MSSPNKLRQQLWFRFADGELKLTPGEMRTSKARILWAIVSKNFRMADVSTD